MIEIREAAPGDWHAVVQVIVSAVATLRETYRPTAEAIDRNRNSQRARLIAVDGTVIVGTVQYETHPERVHLVGLGVLAEHRRRGIARALVAALAQRASTLSLYTIRETGNVEVFERLGFRVVGETPATDCESDDHTTLTEVYMER